MSTEVPRYKVSPEGLEFLQHFPFSVKACLQRATIGLQVPEVGGDVRALTLWGSLRPLLQPPESTGVWMGRVDSLLGQQQVVGWRGMWMGYAGQWGRE